MISKIGGHLGYLIVDHGASPGVSEAFVQDFARRTGKEAPPAVPEGKVFEADTYKCPHCDGIVIKNPQRARPRNVCRKCMRVICDNPSCNAGCLPTAQVLEVAATQAHRDLGVGVSRVGQAILNLRRDVLGQ